VARAFVRHRAPEQPSELVSAERAPRLHRDAREEGSAFARSDAPQFSVGAVETKASEEAKPGQSVGHRRIDAELTPYRTRC
jgi:hypothetical protein